MFYEKRTLLFCSASYFITSNFYECVKLFLDSIVFHQILINSYTITTVS